LRFVFFERVVQLGLDGDGVGGGVAAHREVALGDIDFQAARLGGVAEADLAVRGFMRRFRGLLAGDGSVSERRGGGLASAARSGVATAAPRRMVDR
jgi:hypothetical protein